MKKNIVLTTTIIFLLFIIVSLNKIVGFTINIKWFQEVGYLSVYFTKIVAVLKLMVPIFIISYISIWIYYRSLRKSILRWKKAVEVNLKSRRYENKIFIAANIIISFFISYVFSSNYWYKILQFNNATSFNIKDPIFNNDISFYIFKLPLIEGLYGTLMFILVLLVVVTLITYFILNAKDRIYSGESNPFSNISVLKSGITKFAGRQLAIVSSLIMLLLSLGYLIKSWNLVYSPRGVVFGASYTDVKVTLVFYKVIIVFALIASIIIFVSVMASKVKPIVISLVLIFLLIVSEGITSTLVQTFIVKSNEKSFEKPYINYNIENTRKAFNINNIEEKPFNIKDDLSKTDLDNNKGSIDNIKVNSVQPTSEFYNQVQVMRPYYTFNDVDVDRYDINGKQSQVFLSAREINSDTLENNTWQNRHLTYTHGYGVVMSKVNSVTPDGQPNFVIKDIPPVNGTDIPLTDPKIYFGEKTNDYAIVNTGVSEFDYPVGGSNKNTKYSGEAGINMSLLNKLLFSINQKDINFLLSRDIKSDSKILINRNIVQRVNKIAPFLNYDKDPYVVISNGKLYWILDAYTTSNRYPFSTPEGGINYIRNSVKVVIDAVNGTTDFYIVDKNDPIAASYDKIFPDLFKDLEKAPKDIKTHFRYPEQLFNMQCNVLGKYHVTDNDVFYNGEYQWEISRNFKEVEAEKTANEASYVVMKLPENNKEEMILLNSFTMKTKNNMISLLGARMDGDNYGKLTLYTFQSQDVYSPYLFKQKLNQDTTISQQLSLWNKEGSKIVYGDTTILPIKNSLLYVEPVYLRASGVNSIPEMKRVIVGYGNKIVMAENINSALAQLFAIPNAQNPEVVTPIVPSGGITASSEKIKEANDLYQKAVEAQKAGDWAKYGENIKKLGELLNSLSK
jgi:uncharacterized protein